MIQQLRIYCGVARSAHAKQPAKANAAPYEIVQCLPIMRRYGFQVGSMWESRHEGSTEFLYLLTWPDLATKEDAWRRFMADEEWKEIKRVTRAKHGDLVGEIEDRVLMPV